MAYTYYPYQPNYFQSQMPGQMYRQEPYQPPQQQVPQQQQNSPSIVWVQSEAEAMAYLVAPNSAVTLWDSNAPVVYLKQADASGKPSMKIYDLVERTQRFVQAPQPQSVEYATKDELNALAARLDALAVKEAPTRVTTKKTVKEDAE